MKFIRPQSQSAFPPLKRRSRGPLPRLSPSYRCRVVGTRCNLNLVETCSVALLETGNSRLSGKTGLQGSLRRGRTAKNPRGWGVGDYVGKGGLRFQGPAGGFFGKIIFRASRGRGPLQPQFFGGKTFGAGWGFWPGERILRIIGSGKVVKDFPLDPSSWWPNFRKGFFGKRKVAFFLGWFPWEGGAE